MLAEIVDEIREWIEHPYFYNGLESVPAFQRLVELANKEKESIVFCTYCDNTGYQEIGVGEWEPCIHCLSFANIKNGESKTLEERMAEIEKRMDAIESRMKTEEDESYEEYTLRIARSIHR